MHAGQPNKTLLGQLRRTKMAYYENQFRVNVEFLRSSQPRVGRVIRLNHKGDLIPPQLQGRLSPDIWAAFMNDVTQLAAKHPYTQSPSGGQVCNWAACFALGSILGFFCVDPDGGDYGTWTSEVNQLLQRFAPAFGQAGCGLSLQRNRREYYIQIDLDPNFAMGQPFAQVPPAGKAAHF